MDQVLHADNTILAKVIFDNLVVRKRDALSVDFTIAALVNELADGLQVRVAVGNVRVDNGKHFRRSLGQTNENTVVDLQQPKQLENLARLRSNLVDTIFHNNQHIFSRWEWNLV